MNVTEIASMAVDRWYTATETVLSVCVCVNVVISDS